MTGCVKGIASRTYLTTVGRSLRSVYISRNAGKARGSITALTSVVALWTSSAKVATIMARLRLMIIVRKTTRANMKAPVGVTARPRSSRLTPLEPRPKEPM